MASESLWEISVRALPQAEEHIAEILENLTSQSPVICTSAETLQTMVSVFSSTKPSLGLISRLKAELQTAVTVRRMRAEDWAHSWKKHFKPFEIGSALLVKPGWSKRRAKKNQAVVIIDPGLSFGTGQHHTTRFCLEQLVRFRDSGKRQTFLDVGTGSGILAIAAANLGYTSVLGFDIDADAIRVAKENARRNRVDSKITLKQQDLSAPRALRKYDLVCANLTADLLLGERQMLLRFLAPGGVLVLAGVLAKEFAQVRAAYADLRLQMIATATEKPWQSGVFRR